MKHRESSPPPRPLGAVGRTPLTPGLQVIDGVPVLRLDRAAFRALDRRSVIIADDLGDEDDEVIA